MWTVEYVAHNLYRYMSSANGKLKILFNNYIYAEENRRWRRLQQQRRHSSRWQQNGRQWSLWIFHLSPPPLLPSASPAYTAGAMKMFLFAAAEGWRKKNQNNLNKNENIGENSFGLLSHGKTLKWDAVCVSVSARGRKVTMAYESRKYFFFIWQRARYRPESHNHFVQKSFRHLREINKTDKKNMFLMVWNMWSAIASPRSHASTAFVTWEDRRSFSIGGGAATKMRCAMTCH